MKRLISLGGKALFCAALFLVPAANAQAAVITFTTNVGGPAPVLNPSSDTFSEDGFDVEAFWATGVGTASGGFIGGHFHPLSGQEAQHYNGSNDLQGFYIEASDGSLFDLDSLVYQVVGGGTIPGYPASPVSVLVSTAFNPTNSVVSQFVAFPVSGSGTLNITGFQGVSRVFISSSSSVNFDNVTLNSVPEPASMLLLGAGALGFAYRRRRNG